MLKALLESELMEPGQKLWLHPNVFASEDKHLFDPNNVVFQLTLDVIEGKPMFRWRRAVDAPEELLSPSRAWFPIFEVVLPGRYTNEVASPVFNHYSLEPAGPTRGEIAEQHGIW